MQKLFNLALTMAEAELMLLANRVQRTTELASQTFPVLATTRCEYRFRKKAVESKEVAGRRNLLQVEQEGTLSNILLIQFLSWNLRLPKVKGTSCLSLILKNIFIFKM